MASNSVRASLLMSMALSVTPKASQSSTALFLVRLVVPNPGMVIAMIFFMFQDIISNALWVESRARVESNPPDIPIIAFFILAWLMRFIRAWACILTISSHRCVFSWLIEGTKGIGFIKRFSSFICGRFFI